MDGYSNQFLLLQVSRLVVGAANASWTAMGWQMPGGNTIQQMMNAYENLMNPFTVTQMIQRWPHISWPQMLLNIADRMLFYLNLLYCIYYRQC
jgi:hypothetical protein